MLTSGGSGRLAPRRERVAGIGDSIARDASGGQVSARETRRRARAGPSPLLVLHGAPRVACLPQAVPQRRHDETHAADEEVAGAVGVGFDPAAADLAEQGARLDVVEGEGGVRARQLEQLLVVERRSAAVSGVEEAE